MPTVQELEAQVAIVNIVQMGLAGALILLMEEHAKLVGGEKEAALMKVRSILDEAAFGLQAFRTTGGAKQNVTQAARQMLTTQLDRAEATTRQRLGLPPKSQTAQ